MTSEIQTERLASVILRATGTVESSIEGVPLNKLMKSLLDEPRACANEILRLAGVDLEDMRDFLNSDLRLEPTIGSNVALSDLRTNMVAESKRLNHQYLGTEHLLLAVVAHATGPLAEYLKRYGVDVDTARTHLFKVLYCE